MWAGWLDAKLVELSLELATSAVTRRRFAKQWSESNPRFRAAHAAASYLEGERIARSVLAARSTPTNARFSMRSGITGSRSSPSTLVRRLLEWAMLDFGPGNPARSRRLEPDRAQAVGARARHAGEG
jgi:hypothetical protein